MEKIEKLTPEQEILLKETYEEWLSVGYNTKPLDREKATKAITMMYKEVGEKPPIVLYFSSPMMCILAYEILRKILKDSQLWSQLRGQLWNQLGNQLRGQLRSQLDSQLGSQLDSQLRNQFCSQLRGQLRNQLGSQLENYFAGQHWCAWEVFYDFCNRIGVSYTSKQRMLLDLWIEQSRQCHWWWPYKGIVLASERHNVLNLKEERLHCEDGMAVAYPDGWGIYALNGVRVPENLVMTSPDKLDPKIILEEQNAEIRREMVRKIGIERVIQGLGAKVIDTWAMTSNNVYELLSFKMPHSNVTAKYLKMQNPSIDIYHVEGVAPHIKTVKEALHWRVGDIEWNPEQLT